MTQFLVTLSLGVHIFNVGRTWEKLMLAARIIAAVENPADVVAVASKEYGQRSVLKYAHYTGAHYIAGRFTPGSLTNQIQTHFVEPRLLIVADPRTDYQVCIPTFFVLTLVSASPLKQARLSPKLTCTWLYLTLWKNFDYLVSYHQDLWSFHFWNTRSTKISLLALKRTAEIRSYSISSY